MSIGHIIDIVSLILGTNREYKILVHIYLQQLVSRPTYHCLSGCDCLVTFRV